MRTECLASDEKTMLNGLAVISHHAALRPDPDADAKADGRDMMHPSLFPIDHMFALLVDLIGQ